LLRPPVAGHKHHQSDDAGGNNGEDHWHPTE
jgi:hypothetical protein